MELPIKSPTWLARRTIAVGDFTRHVALLVGGALAGQLVAVIASPIVTRLYTPSEYGVLGVYMSLLAIISVVAMLRYEAAIPGCQDDSRAVNVAALALVITLIMSIACGALLWFATSYKLTAKTLGPLKPFVILLPFGVIATGSYQLLSMWAIRQHDYDALAKTKLTQNVGMIGTQVTLGVLNIGAGGLLLGHIIGQSGGLGTLLQRMWRRDRTLLHHVSRHNMSEAARHYRRFPMLSGTASLLDASVGYLPVVVLAALYGGTVAGWVTLVQRAIALPLGLIGTSLGQVFFGEIGRLVNAPREVLQALFYRRLKQAVWLGLPMTLGILFLAPPVIPIAFGARWAEAGICVRLLAPMLFVSFISNPFGNTLDVLERQGMHLAREVFRSAILATAFAIALLTHVQWQTAIALISAAGVINGTMYLGMTWWAIHTYTPPQTPGGLQAGEMHHGVTEEYALLATT